MPVNQDIWWQAFYEETPFEHFMERADAAELERTVDFLTEKLEIARGAAVFDQCCGFGSIAIPLSKRGITVFGVDLCQKYIDKARRRAEKEQVACHFVRGDAFVYVPEVRCDAAVNWWTSFGYARDDATNLSMLRRAYESLRNGGCFALDFPNMPYVFRRPSLTEEKRLKAGEEEVFVVRETELDLHRGLRRQIWTFVLPDGNRLVHDTAIRTYLPDTLVSMLERCGFEEVELYGDVDGRSLSLDCERCIAVCRRPA